MKTTNLKSAGCFGVENASAKDFGKFLRNNTLSIIAVSGTLFFPTVPGFWGTVLGVPWKQGILGLAKLFF
jgi:hypothetical protein